MTWKCPLAILCVSNVTLAGLAEVPSVASGADGVLEPAVTGEGVVEVSAVVCAGAGVADWLHPESTRAADIAAPVHMVIFWCLLRVFTDIPQEVVRHEISDETPISLSLSNGLTSMPPSRQNIASRRQRGPHSP